MNVSRDDIEWSTQHGSSGCTYQWQRSKIFEKVLSLELICLKDTEELSQEKIIEDKRKKSSMICSSLFRWRNLRFSFLFRDQQQRRREELHTLPAIWPTNSLSRTKSVSLSLLFSSLLQCFFSRLNRNQWKWNLFFALKCERRRSFHCKRIFISSVRFIDKTLSDNLGWMSLERELNMSISSILNHLCRSNKTSTSFIDQPAVVVNTSNENIINLKKEMNRSNERERKNQLSNKVNVRRVTNLLFFVVNDLCNCEVFLPLDWSDQRMMISAKERRRGSPIDNGGENLVISMNIPMNWSKRSFQENFAERGKWKKNERIFFCRILFPSREIRLLINGEGEILWNIFNCW